MKEEEKSVADQADNALESSRAKPRAGILQTFLQHQASLRNYISRFMVSSHEIDDVSQETFLRAYKAEQTVAIDQPKAFLFRVAKNMLLSELDKKSRKMIDYVEDYEQDNAQFRSDSLEDDLVAQQRLGAFCEAVATLTPTCRKVVLMKKVYGLSYKEIARRMNVSVSAVEKHLIKGGKRCEEVLAERYRDLYPDAVSAHQSAEHRAKGPESNVSQDRASRKEASVLPLPTASKRREL